MYRRFRNSKLVGAMFGLTPSRYQSGESERTGRISRCGDEMMRMMCASKKFQRTLNCALAPTAAVVQCRSQWTRPIHRDATPAHAASLTGGER
jgi:transposase